MRTLFSRLGDWELVDEAQDLRGLRVVDARSGHQRGIVRDMLVETTAERVTAVLLDDGSELSLEPLTRRAGVLVDASGTKGRVATATRKEASMRTVIGLVDDLNEARAAAKDLERIGLRSDQISVVSPERGGTGIGDVMLAPVQITGLGEVNAAGPLTQHLTPETAQADTDGLVAGLERMGVSRQEAVRYVEGVRNGYTLEAAVVEDKDAPRALEILREHAKVQARGEAHDVVKHTDEARIPVVEEELKVGKREVQTGGVRVSTHVLEQPVVEDISLRREHIEVKRHAVNRPVESGDVFQDRSFEVVATEEQAVIAKEARVVEEIVITRDVDTHRETVRDTVRRTDVDIQQMRPFDRSLYQDHYRQLSAGFAKGESATFDTYEPAYRFGHELRSEKRYAGWDWNRLEPAARASWEKGSPGTWERFKMAIRHAWDRAT